MLTAKIIRRQFAPQCTLGEFELRNGLFLLYNCFVCEDAVRGDGDPATVAQWKVKGESAIPYGTYPLRLTPSSKFPPRKWEICDVPGYIGIRIHAGRTDKDTEGCPLLGEKLIDLRGVANSTVAVAKFEGIMAKHGNADAMIEIVKGEA